jgi:P27 family predicted phage terminase small subunit
MGGQGSGARPKPSQVKKLEGNRRQRGRGRITTDPRGKGRPREPVTLSGEALELWRDVVSSLPDELLSRADEAHLEAFAREWATYHEADQMIQRTGLLVIRESGEIANPALRIRNDACDRMYRLGGVLGLTPVARARLATSTPLGEAPDPMALLLGPDRDPDGAWRSGPKTRQ